MLPADVRVVLEAQLLYKLERLEHDYGVRCTDIKIVMAETDPPKIVNLELVVEPLEKGE
jgi:hypothetical protein